MKLFRTRKQTPQGAPPSGTAYGGAGDQRLVWEVLVPRLLYPSRVALIRTLLKHRHPLSLKELADAIDITVEHARYHCKVMQTAGVLEVVTVIPCAKDEDDEPVYYFPDLPTPIELAVQGDSG